MAKKYIEETEKTESILTLPEARRQGVKTVLLQELNGNIIAVDNVDHMSYELMNCYVFDHYHSGSMGTDIPLFKKRWH